MTNGSVTPVTPTARIREEHPVRRGHVACAPCRHSLPLGGFMSDSAVATQAEPPPRKRDRSHWLYIAVISSVMAAILGGCLWPSFGIAVRPLGTAIVKLLRMFISPV